MTEQDPADAPPAETATPLPATRRERRLAMAAPRPPARITVTGVIGELLITAGVVVMLFLAWYLWLNDAVVGSEQQVAAEEVQQELQERWERGEGAAERPVDPGEPIVSAAPTREGEVFGTLIVPRFGPDWKRSIASGVDVETVLNSFTVGVGHYVDTQMPGELGNFAIAGHRRTYGSAFGDIDKLRLGDKIYVETVDGWYQYTFRGLEYVWPTGVEVIEPVPAAPGVAPTDRVLTMTSCNPRWSTAERIMPTRSTRPGIRGPTARRPSSRRLSRPADERRPHEGGALMYAALWRVLPGPVWLRVIILVVLAGLVAAALMQWVFPWAANLLLPQESAVGGP